MHLSLRMFLSHRRALVRTSVVAALAATALTAVSVPALADDGLLAGGIGLILVVLYSMLPAATAPADVTAAAKYVATAGGKVDAAPEGVTWDPNVVGMLQYPEVLQWMNENPSWLEQMGFAMATQQADVLAAVQRYRAKASRTPCPRSRTRR